MSNGQANSHVTQVDLKDNDSIVLTVQFDGFTANEPVEISGYVVQSDGAYSPFYLQTTVPNYPSLSGSLKQVPVTIDNITGLRYSDKVMVVTKVAKVWPTVLKAEESNPPTPTGPRTDPPTGKIVATWKAVPPPPWDANW